MEAAAAEGARCQSNCVQAGWLSPTFATWTLLRRWAIQCSGTAPLWRRQNLKCNSPHVANTERTSTATAYIGGFPGLKSETWGTQVHGSNFKFTRSRC